MPLDDPSNHGQSSIQLNFFEMSRPLRLNEIIYQFSNHEWIQNRLNVHWPCATDSYEKDCNKASLGLINIFLQLLFREESIKAQLNQYYEALFICRRVTDHFYCH